MHSRLILSTMKKLTIQLILAVFVTAFGVALIIAAMCLPPQGVIDPTVLTAYGETLTFAGSLIGIDYHYKSKKGGDSDGIS